MVTHARSRERDRYVQVAVNAGRPTDMTFAYRVPPGREVEAGEVVHVPFGKRTLQGIVVEGPTGFSGYHGDIRDLDPAVEGAPRLNDLQLELARWIAHYYLAPPWEAHALMLPPGAGERPRRLLLRGSAEPPEALSERQQQIYELLDETPREAGRLRAALPGRVAARAFEAALTALLRRGLAERRYELSRPSGRPRIVEVVRLVAEPDAALRFAGAIEGRRASRRARALRALLDAAEPIAVDELAKIARGRPAVETLIEDGDVEVDGRGLVTLALSPERAVDRIREWTRTRAQDAAARMLERFAGEPELSLPLGELAREFGAAAREALAMLREEGLLTVEEVLDRRDPLRSLDVAVRPSPELIFEQRPAARAITEAIDRGNGEALLLAGVSGSGKTEVYLAALQHAVKQGKRGIVLVPEIALTVPTVSRFAERFPGRVGVLHSGPQRGRALRRVARHRRGRVRRGDRLAFGDLRASTGPRADRDRRGARVDLQAGGPGAALRRAHGRRADRGAERRGAGLRHGHAGRRALARGRRGPPPAPRPASADARRAAAGRGDAGLAGREPARGGDRRRAGAARALLR